MRLWSIKSLKSNLLAIMRLARRSASVLDTDFSAFSTRLNMSPADHETVRASELVQIYQQAEKVFLFWDVQTLRCWTDMLRHASQLKLLSQS